MTRPQTGQPPSPAHSIDERERLAALSGYQIDTHPEEAFDALTRLAAHICGTPMALLTVIDAEYQWSKSSVGISFSQSAREEAMCAYTIEGREPFIIPDARADARFASSPAVVQEPYLRFYAGAPLLTPDGHALGALCVLDRKPRQLSAAQLDSLAALSQEAMTQLELRRQNRELAPARDRLEVILETAGEGIYELDPQGRVRFINRAAAHMLGWEVDELVGRRMHETIHHLRADGTPYPAEQCPLLAPLTEGKAHPIEQVFWRKDGTPLPVKCTSTPVKHGATQAGTVVIFRDITKRKQAETALSQNEEAQRFLSETTAMLSSSLDYELTLKRLAELAVPTLADFCFFDIATADGEVKCVGWTHVDRDKQHAFEEAAGFVPPPDLDSHPISRVLATGQAEFVPEVTDDWMQATATSERHLRFMRELELGSVMMVPLSVQGRTLGALTLCYSAGRHYTRGQLDLAEEFARRAAIAIDNAQLYRMAQKELVERQQAEALLTHLSNYDALTGLANRELSMERLAQALSEAAQHKHSVAVMFLDLDRFKRINDTLGHELGDQLLKAVAKRLQACTRKSDTVARLSGDEFVITLAKIAAAADAWRIAQKLLSALAKPFKFATHELVVTASIGICVYPREARKRETLLQRADAAMYLAKQRGGDQCQHYSPALGGKASRRLALEGKLRHALANDEFFLLYQPQVNPESGRILAVEALLRWRSGANGHLVPPEEFIPVAEAQGLIVPIGEWVLRTACAQNQAWRAQGLAPIPVAVNLSARQFHQADMTKTIARILKQTGLEPAGLELELTETLLQTVDSDKALRPLKRMGVKVSIDDFGTGYSSLSYIKRFAIDSLKIDHSFVTGIPHNADDSAIVTAIVAMARGLKLKVIAEGVETATQLEFLRSLKCDAIQGHLFNKPLSPEALATLLRNESAPNAPKLKLV